MAASKLIRHFGPSIVLALALYFSAQHQFILSGFLAAIFVNLMDWRRDR